MSVDRVYTPSPPLLPQTAVGNSYEFAEEPETGTFHSRILVSGDRFFSQLLSRFRSRFESP